MSKVINKRIDIRLTEREYEFLKWLADRDDVILQEELKALFYLQLREEMDLYEEEMKMEQEQERSSITYNKYTDTYYYHGNWKEKRYVYT